MKRLTYLIVLICLCAINTSIAQIVAVDNNISAHALIQNNLAEGCVEISNISSSINGSINGFSSFGYFERGTSNFPFENGIMLSTGNASSGGNAINSSILNDGEVDWGTDTDLETALGITNTLNATSIEFDFVSVSNLIQFNYILASEEYFANFPCDYSDGFAFLIKRTGTNDPYINIALIPGTNTPVNTNTVHDEIVGFCPAESQQFFDGYGMGDTNYNGRTTELTATANIVPNVQYHIKLVIADQNDENYDSAVFIQGNSFNPTVDLGQDVSTCAQNYILNGDIQNPLASYKWYQDGVLLSGETGTNLSVTTSGDYKVEIIIPLSNSDCFIEDTISVSIDSEQSAAPISDYQVCDDSSRDGIETFVLSIKNSEVLNAVPQGNYSISYHLSDEDAQNNTNVIIGPIQNTISPQPIYVRIEDTDNGCLAYTNFNLIVLELPEITTPADLILCDDNIADGSTTMDLTLTDDEITNGNTNLFVSYHYSQNDADSGNNPIASPYVNTNPTETIYVRVYAPDSGCYSSTTLNIEVIANPVVNVNVAPLNACVSTSFSNFNLTDVISDVLQGLTGVTTTFHITDQDAQTGENPIADETNFENTLANVQTIYLRVVDDNTGCATVVPFQIHTNLLVTGTFIHNFFTCDDDSGDGVAPFNLLSIGAQIINNISNVSITFYESQTDLNNNTNPINQNVPYIVNSSPKLLYLKLESPDCEYISEINLLISPPILLANIDPIDYCDTDDDGLTSIDLSEFDTLVSNSLDNVSVRYFTNNTSANNNTNALNQFYTNTSNPQTLYARVTSTNTSCYNTIAFDINVIPAPTVNSPIEIIICDDDQDGFSSLNLNDITPSIVADTTNLLISFHRSLNDLNNNQNAISTPMAYNADTQTIFTRVESTITGCYATAQINIIINTLPDFTEISNFQNCENDNDQTTTFLLNTKDPEILNNQSGKEVLYFETQIDAINRTNSINKNLDYTNLSNPQTIYTRVENNTDQDCFGVSSFILEVGSVPLFNPPTTFAICDDISNDGFETFNLNDKIIEMSQGIPENLSIRFYTSFTDAENLQNEIALDYTNIINPQQIYARVENGNFCHAIAEFGLNVIQVPTVNLPSAMVTCDDDYDGISFFDLSTSELQILDVRNNDIIVTYFETLEELEGNTNEILSPKNYNNISNPQTVYVKVKNTISDCFVSVALELMVNLPPVINAIEPIEICDNNSQTYNLTEAINLLITNTSNITVTFFHNNADAISNQNEIGNTYTYDSPNKTISLRATDNSSGCYAISSFDLIVHPNPIANTVADLEKCDDDYNFEQYFDLSQQTPIILGTQNPNQFTVSYHEILNDAMDSENKIENLNYNAIDGQEIFIRIENNTTFCYNITSFFTIVNRKPVVDIPQQVICLDNFPLTVIAGEIVDGDSYLWSTNETTSEIDIRVIGDYWVTVTTAYGCETTSTFNVIESEQATIETTETIDFTNPNNITVTISGIGNYMYILDDGVPQEHNIFTNVSIGYHILTIIDLNGCAEISKEVIVVDTPKFFTPNGDGYFDTWHITGVETLEGTTINIYDRYGKQMTYLTSSSTGWDGTYNGHLMPSNDYWYVANVKKGDQEFQLKGHFALKR